MPVTIISGSLVADLTFNEVQMTYAGDNVATVTYLLGGVPQAQVVYTYDGAGRCVRQVRSNV